MSKIFAFLFIVVGLCFLAVNAIIIVSEGNYSAENAFMLGITGLIVGTALHNKDKT